MDPPPRGLPSVEQVIAATKAAVPPISSICARLSSPLHLPPPPSLAVPHDVLRVILGGARDLLDNRGRIQGDLYVRLRLGTVHHYESETIYDSAAPAWHEGFCFDMQAEDGDGMLEVGVLDRRHAPEDYVVGVAYLDLYALHPALMEQGTVEVVLGLTNQGAHVGSLDAVVTPVGRAHLERPSTQHALRMPSPQMFFEGSVSSSAVSEDSKQQSYLPSPVHVPSMLSLNRTNVVQLTLLGFDPPETIEPPRAPPSVRFSLGPRHQRFELLGAGPYGTFMVDLQERHKGDTLEITAMEKHAMCGQGKLPLALLRELPFGQTLDCRVPLIWMSAPSGVLLLQAERLPGAPHRMPPGPTAGPVDLRQYPSAPPPSTPIEWCGTIRVTVGDAEITTRKPARNLDPYVRLKFGRTACETEVRYGADNPVPFREAFDLYHPSGAGSVLEVLLMDKKQHGVDALVGRGFVDLAEFLAASSTRMTGVDVQLTRQGLRQGVVGMSLLKIAERQAENAARLVPPLRERVQVTVFEAHRLTSALNGPNTNCHVRLQLGAVEHHTSAKALQPVVAWREGFLFEHVRPKDVLTLTAVAATDRKTDVIGTGTLDMTAMLACHDGECVKVPLTAQKRQVGVVIVSVAAPRETRVPKAALPPITPTRVSRPATTLTSRQTDGTGRRRLSTEPSTRSSTESSTAHLIEPWDTVAATPEAPRVPPLPLHRMSSGGPGDVSRSESSQDGGGYPQDWVPAHPEHRSAGRPRSYREHSTEFEPREPEGRVPASPPRFGPFIPAGKALASPRLAAGPTRYGAQSHSHHFYSR